MADTQTTVTTLDIQMLNADRADATTIKLDNPKENVTREMVSSAMQPAFTNGWFLTTKGDPAMYLGDVTINQSIKTKLGGEDFYVTPDRIGNPNSGQYFMIPSDTKIAETSVSVTGATIQGYNWVLSSVFPNFIPTATISENKLSVNIKFDANNNVFPLNSTATFSLILIIQGIEVTIPIAVRMES